MPKNHLATDPFKIKIRNFFMYKMIKSKKIIFVTIIIAIAGFWYFGGQGAEKENAPTSINQTKTVSSLIIGEEQSATQIIKTVGEAEASSVADIASFAQGTVKQIYFKTGDIVKKGQVLAVVQNLSLSANLSGAQSGYASALNNLNAAELSKEEIIKQAEIGIENAEKTIQSAQIGVNTAQNNLDNSLLLQSKNKADLLTNGVNLYSGYLNTIQYALDQINYILHEDAGPYLSTTDNILGARNVASVSVAKSEYNKLKIALSLAKNITPTTITITNDLSIAIDVLNQTKIATDVVIDVWNNTITNNVFSDADLSTQITAFNTLKSNLVSSVSSAQSSLNSIQNIDITQSKETQSLRDALSSAQSNLEQSNVAYQNALANLETVKKGQDQQIAGSLASLSAAKSQIAIASSQTAELYIKAYSGGKILNKYAEIGTPVSPGQKIARVGNTDLITIAIDLSAEDVGKIKVSDEVMLNETLRGEITHIDPVADPQSRKVRVEVSFDNSKKEIVAQTFVNVEIKITNDNAGFLIPVNATMITASEHFVFVNSDGKAQKRIVELGNIVGDKIEIKTGLSVGDEVIVDGARLLNDGDEVSLN